VGIGNVAAGVSKQHVPCTTPMHSRVLQEAQDTKNLQTYPKLILLSRNTAFPLSFRLGSCLCLHLPVSSCWSGTQPHITYCSTTSQ